MGFGLGAAIGGIASGLLGKSASDKAGKYAKDASKYSIQEQRRQYDLTRKDLQPWQTAGVNALGQYEAGIGQPTPMYGAFPGGTPVPQYTNQVADPAAYVNQAGAPPEYTNQAGPVPEYNNLAGPVPEYNNLAGDVPEFTDRSRFSFNLQEDPIYKYQRDQALQAATRGQNAAGGQLSGGLLNELARVGAGEAGKYQDAAFRRQLAGSQENYGRAAGEYGMDVARNREQYGRGVTDYGIQAARNRETYGRGVQDYGIEAGINRETYGRGLQDYAAAAERNRDIYGRGVQDYGIESARNRDLYGRGVQDYGLGLQGNQAQYARDLNDYQLDVARNQDIYGRDQNYLNRLADLSAGGQNAAARLGGLGAASAANIGNIAMQGAAQRGQAALGGASAINNAIQGTMSNYLLNNYLNPSTGYTGIGSAFDPANSFGGYR